MRQNQWLPTTKAAEAIGVTAKYLRENRLLLFTAGYHYRCINPTAIRPTYRWCPERCAKLLDEETKKAAKIELSQQPTAKGRGVQLPFVSGVKPYEIE